MKYRDLALEHNHMVQRIYELAEKGTISGQDAYYLENGEWAKTCDEELNGDY